MDEKLADSETNSDANAAEESRRKKCCCSVPITIEPAVYLFCLATTFSLSVTTNLFVVHTCENSLDYNHTVCMELGDKTLNDTMGLEGKVQPLVTYYKLGKSLSESILPTILSFYVGPWSDTNGRKPIIMWPMLGFMLSYLIFMVESMIPETPPALIMVSSLPSALCGGFMSFQLGMYSYISDVSKPENRTLRLGMVELSVFAGLLTSSLTVPHVYHAAGEWGYVTVYAVSAACCLLAWLYCLLFVQESVVNDETKYPCCFVSLELFKNRYAADMYKACFEKRPYISREKVLILFFVLGACISVSEGDNAVLFLFTRKKFEWDLSKFSTYSAYVLGMNVIGLLFGTRILGSWLKLSPGVLTVITFFTKMVASCVVAFSPASWYLYMGAAIGVLGACVSTWCRSILSTSIPKTDIGKIFAFVSSMESIMPLIAGPMYSLLYNATIQSFPGAFCMISASIFSINMVLLIRVEILQRRKDRNFNIKSPLTDNDEIPTVK